MNILEVNKSCFKDCFYSFSHEHTRGYTHLFFLIPRPRPLRFPPPPANPASRFSVEHCLSFELSFVISSLNFCFSFLSLVSCPAPPPLFLLQFSSLFSLVFFFVFYQSVAHGPFRRRDPRPTRWKLTSFCFSWDDLQCSHHHHRAHDEKGHSNTRANSFLPGSSYMCVSVCMC